MKNYFVILDRDGTINEECDHLTQANQVVLLPNTGSGLRKLASLGVGLVVITNQSVVGRGLISLEELHEIHSKLVQLLEKENVRLDGIYVCPHSPEDECECRKPRTGLLDRAMKELDFDNNHCVVIGDKTIDIEFGKNAGTRTILVRTGYGAEMERNLTITPDVIVNDLEDASEIIHSWQGKGWLK